MTEKFFVDTNVLVYRYDVASASKQAIATEWTDRFWRDRSGRTSTQVINELYWSMTRKIPRRLSADEAWQVVQKLMSWKPQPVDRAMLLRAREVERRFRISWWDSLIVAAAQLQECDVLLTEDLQDGMRFEGVRVQNPFVLQVQEPWATYSVVTNLSAHRRRPEPPRRPQPAGLTAAG